ncbi:MAG: cystathionine beta-lyase, partial [Duncaniella sp.]|nr:cystathionine beta-lyase [Duncaniella sp.]
NRIQAPVARLEATFLLWLDIQSFGIPAERLEENLLDKTGVWVNSGTMYGKEGYIRINLACPRSLLEEGLVKLHHHLCPEL